MSSRTPYALLFEFETEEGDRMKFEASLQQLLDVVREHKLPIEPFLVTAFCDEAADRVAQAAHGRDCAVRVSPEGDRETGGPS